MRRRLLIKKRLLRRRFTARKAARQMADAQETLDDPVKEERGGLQPFEELFKSHHRRVYSLCLRMTGNCTEAEDLSQDVFVQVFRKLATFRGESAFTTWLYRLTVNYVLMHFRKVSSRKERLTEDGDLPEHVLKGRNVLTSSPILDRLALEEAIAKLAPGYRAVFILHDIKGLQHIEIANVLGGSVGTSKSQLHKARLKLRTLLLQRAHSSKAASASQQTHARLDRLPPPHSPKLLGQGLLPAVRASS